jgi:hypothetical protein
MRLVPAVLLLTKSIVSFTRLGVISFRLMQRSKEVLLPAREIGWAVDTLTPICLTPCWMINLCFGALSGITVLSSIGAKRI